MMKLVVKFFLLKDLKVLLAVVLYGFIFGFGIAQPFLKDAKWFKWSEPAKARIQRPWDIAG